MSVDSLTFLKSKGPKLCKTIAFDPKTRLCREIGGYSDAKYFSVSQVKVESLGDVFDCLKGAAQDSKTALIWGAPASGVNMEYTSRDHDFFPEVPRHWIPFDLDAFEFDAEIFDSFAELSDLAALARDELPIEFRAARCVFNATNRHGLEHGKARLRLYFWAEEPVTRDGMKAWVKSCPAKIDPSPWTSNQLIYIANPAIERDFIEERWGWLEGESAVLVPNYVLTASTAAVTFNGSTDAYERYPDEVDSAAALVECINLFRGILSRKVAAGEFGASGTRREFWTRHSNIFGDFNISNDRGAEIAVELMAEFGVADEKVLGEIPSIIKRYDTKRKLARGYSTHAGRAGDFGPVVDKDEAPPPNQKSVRAAGALPFVDVISLKDISLNPPPWPCGALPGDLELFAAHVGARLCVEAAVSLFAHAVCMSAMIPMGITFDVLRDGTFAAHTATYAMIVGRSGSAKSPTLNAALAPLESAERIWGVENAKAIATFRLEEERFKRAGKPAKSKVEPSEYYADMPLHAPEPPKIRRRLVSDATTEALAGVFMQTGEGLIMVVDELAAMFGNIDRYHSGRGGASKDSATFLSAYDGRMIRVDRKSSDTISVDRTHLSIIGTIQPAILAPLISNLSGDGLVQRFIICNTGEPFVKRDSLPLDETLADAYRQACNLLLNCVRVHGPMTFKPSFAALEIWRGADEWTRAAGLPNAESEAERGFISKMPNLLARTALSLHLVDWSWEAGLGIAVGIGEDDNAPGLEIGADVMSRAWRLVKDFHLKNAKQTYANAERAERLDHCKKIARWLRDLPERNREIVTLRDCYRKFRSYLERRNDLFLALGDLESYGWLEPIDGKSWKIRAEMYPQSQDKVAA